MSEERYLDADNAKFDMLVIILDGVRLGKDVGDEERKERSKYEAYDIGCEMKYISEKCKVPVLFAGFITMQFEPPEIDVHHGNEGAESEDELTAVDYRNCALYIQAIQEHMMWECGKEFEWFMVNCTAPIIGGRNYGSFFNSVGKANDDSVAVTLCAVRKCILAYFTGYAKEAWTSRNSSVIQKYFIHKALLPLVEKGECRV